MKLPILHHLTRALFALSLFLGIGLARAADSPLPWQDLTPRLMEQARSDNKPVFLYLEAVWCHWCHVMQRETFSDSAVQALLKQHYLLARVDHDAYPAIANRYRDYGWPALIFFNAQGQEVVKRAGFIGPQPFAALLQAIVNDPSPEQGAAPLQASAPVRATQLSPALRRGLEGRHQRAYDPRLGGLKLAQKYLDADSLEYALRRAQAGSALEKTRALQTLDAARVLIDPVWGGAYQYSTHGDWQHPHFEKIMRSQAKVLGSYALAYQAFGRAQDLASAQAMRDYLLGFLQSPEGGFYVSQDADVVPGQKSATYFALGDAARRAQGLPKVDQHLYAQETGKAIAALALLHQVSGDAVALAAAIRAADWALAQRQRPDGSFAHGSNGQGDLGDTLQMANGLLALYRATGSPRWLTAAQFAGEAMQQRFAAADAGLLTGEAAGAVVPPVRVVEENIIAARFYSGLAQASGKTVFLEASDHILAWLYQPNVALDSLTEPGILLAAQDRAAAAAALGH